MSESTTTTKRRLRNTNNRDAGQRGGTARITHPITIHGDDMAEQQQTQDIISQLSKMFGDRLKGIEDKLDDLVTRREHEKDLDEITGDFANQQKQLDRLQAWADVRPRQSADAEWVRRIEADVRGIQTRMANGPDEMRQRFAVTNAGIGTILALAALVVLLLQHLSFH